MFRTKFSYMAAVVSSVIFIGSCSNMFGNDEAKKNKEVKIVKVNQKYGAYLAGRVAHLRRDFNSAADYYVEALKGNSGSSDLIARLYIIMASEGRIDEAAVYAKESIKNGDTNNFTYIIIAVDEMKKGQNLEAIKTMEHLKGDVYDEFINPLIVSWAYVAENNKDKALEELGKISKEPFLKALYNFHAGMINDYFGDNETAQIHYETIERETKMEMSFRALQVISNFYIRTNQQDKAVALVEKYNDDKNMIDMLRRLLENVKDANPKKAERLIRNANDGLAEALFSISATLRQGPAGTDLAHIFICLSIYANNDYDLSKLLLADILESREMYGRANEIYNEIGRDSVVYYTARLKAANNLTIQKKYGEAAAVLRKLMKDNPDDYQVLLDLADNLRMMKQYGEAIKYYNLALDNAGEISDKHWIAYYALGVAYERNKDWPNAEKNLKRALELSQNHYLVLNYIGYCWITRGENIEEAFSLAVDAYNQAPNDGHIVDSLGWALYNLGLYDEAVKYLENASELEPANALISDHLGDAYWRAGRKVEALYQWQHALVLEDDLEEVSKDVVRDKIDNGLGYMEIPKYDVKFIEEKLKSIEK